MNDNKAEILFIVANFELLKQDRVLNLISLNCMATAERSLDGLVFIINTVKLYPSLSDTQHGDEWNPREQSIPNLSGVFLFT